MLRIVRSNQGGVLVIVLMVIMIIGLLIPASYSMYNKLLLNDSRIVHQKQAVNVAVSAMEAFEGLSQLDKVQYLIDNQLLSQDPIKLLDRSKGSLDLYQFALDKDGNELTLDKLKNYIGEYTFVVQGVSGDLNHNHQKDSNEKFYVEHEMKVVATTVRGPGQHVYLHQDEKYVLFETFLDMVDKNGPYHGDVTIYDVSDQSSVYSDSKIFNIAANGFVHFEGNYKIESTFNGKEGHSDPYNIRVYSATGDIKLTNTTLVSTGKSAKRNMAIHAPKGNITIENTSLSSQRDIYIFAGWGLSFLHKDAIPALPSFPSKDIKIENSHLYAKNEIIKKKTGLLIEP